MFDISPVLSIFALLVAGHAVADYPLQGDFLAKAKNRANPIPGVGWYHGLFAHAAIHGGMVGMITGSVWLGLFEFVIHSIIDDLKCNGRIGFDTDQALHILCKLAYVAIFVFGVLPWPI